MIYNIVENQGNYYNIIDGKWKNDRDKIGNTTFSIYYSEVKKTSYSSNHRETNVFGEYYKGRVLNKSNFIEVILDAHVEWVSMIYEIETTEIDGDGIRFKAKAKCIFKASEENRKQSNGK